MMPVLHYLVLWLLVGLMTRADVKRGMSWRGSLAFNLTAVVIFVALLTL